MNIELRIDDEGDATVTVCMAGDPPVRQQISVMPSRLANIAWAVDQACPPTGDLSLFEMMQDELKRHADHLRERIAQADQFSSKLKDALEAFPLPQASGQPSDDDD